MPRIPRRFVDSFVYHILNRGNAKQEIFHKVDDYRAFINLISEAKMRYPIKLFAYCLMPNHFHLGLGVIESEKVSKYMHWLMTTHVQRYHQHYNTSGHIWQGRFKDFLIKEDTHLLTVLRYIEGNPVRSGLVSSARDWIWSSHLERIGEGGFNILDGLPIDLPKDWTRYIDEPLTEKELGQIRKSVNRRTPYGDAEWKLQICKKRMGKGARHLF